MSSANLKSAPFNGWIAARNSVWLQTLYAIHSGCMTVRNSLPPCAFSSLVPVPNHSPCMTLCRNPRHQWYCQGCHGIAFCSQSGIQTQRRGPYTRQQTAEGSSFEGAPSSCEGPQATTTVRDCSLWFIRTSQPERQSAISGATSQPHPISL